MHDLSKVIFSYSAYPSNEPKTSVSYALVEKFPCLKEPGSFAGLYGWQQRIKNKMHNYRAKLKSRKYAYPELEVNTLRRKCPADAHPAKNVKKAKKAFFFFFSSCPVGHAVTVHREKRDVAVCCLTEYLGEKQEDLFQDCQVC